MSADHSLPISIQDTYEVVPVFNYDVEEWNPNRGQLSVMAIEDNRNLVQYFGNWQTIQLKMPAIAQVIKGMAKKDEVLVAKMDSYIKNLIDNCEKNSVYDEARRFLANDTFIPELDRIYAGSTNHK